MHFETDEDVDNEYWSSNHNAHATHRISNSLHNESMNLLHLPEKYHTSILNGGADNCVIGQGWGVKRKGKGVLNFPSFLFTLSIFPPFSFLNFGLLLHTF
jgi:hypothetical protein